MTAIELYQWTLAVAILLVVLEMLTGTFLLLGCAIGLIPVVLFHYGSSEIHWARDLSVFSIVSAVAFVGLRKFFLKPNDNSSTEADINKY
ncbi:MAG: NfeD family protein [Burkholderiaceae bacterium]|jgi:membrane protein implicated in regulation of membrane protease activity